MSPAKMPRARIVLRVQDLQIDEHGWVDTTAVLVDQDDYGRVRLDAVVRPHPSYDPDDLEVHIVRGQDGYHIGVSGTIAFERGDSSPLSHAVPLAGIHGADVLTAYTRNRTVIVGDIDAAMKRDRSTANQLINRLS